jgi:phosphoribosylaminoimidazole-succinocarboxamide synthase
VIGQEEAQMLRRLSLAVYERAAEIADDRDLILADTKFEFGTQADGTIVLADEILTPDSSRYWPVDGWEPGHPQPSFDKQYVRDWLMSPESGWDRHSGEAPPPLPDEVVEKTRQKYIEAYERLTGKRFN